MLDLWNNSREADFLFLAQFIPWWSLMYKRVQMWGLGCGHPIGGWLPSGKINHLCPVQCEGPARHPALTAGPAWGPVLTSAASTEIGVGNCVRRRGCTWEPWRRFCPLVSLQLGDLCPQGREDSTSTLWHVSCNSLSAFGSEGRCRGSGGRLGEGRWGLGSWSPYCGC